MCPTVQVMKHNIAYFIMINILSDWINHYIIFSFYLD